MNLKPYQVFEYIAMKDEEKQDLVQLGCNFVWLVSMYTRLAVHSPKNLPKEPIKIKNESVKDTLQTQEEQDAIIDSILNTIK